MTEKTAGGGSGAGTTSSIIERVAKRISGDLAADLAEPRRPNGIDGATVDNERDTVIEGWAGPIEDAVRAQPLPENGPVEEPPMADPAFDPAPEPAAEPAVIEESSDQGTDAGGAERSDRGGSFDLNIPRLAAMGFVTPDAGRSRKTEEYRLIKRALLNRRGAAPTNPRDNLIMITSALPDEGKTFTGVNLAISMAAEENTSVLLIDADFNKRGAVKALGCPDKMGLIDVLENPDLDLADVMVKTNIRNFSFVPAGQPHKRSTELLASDRMARLAAEIGGRYRNRVTIFDCPPLLMTTEAAALTAHVGQVLFVVRAEKTKEATVRHALELVDQVPHVGLVLNGTRSRLGSTELGNYEYYYGYNSY